MTDKIKIRLMTTEDIDTVHEIEKTCFSSPWSKNSFYDEITSNICARYMVAEINGKVCGYGGMWLIINEAHITNIAVHPNFRRKKIGSKLLNAMMLLAHNELEVKRMTLEVRKSNHAAQSMYRKFGFLVAGERKKYYDNNEDASIMWCDNISEFIKKE
jgi:ribosomal-protein-alanine N-acetyltransferase